MREAAPRKIRTLSPPAGPRTVDSSRARETLFASLSRELRWSLDADGRFLLLEGAWQSVLGLEPEQLHGWHWEEIVHPADRGVMGAALARLRTTDSCERDVQTRVATGTGGYRVVTWTMVAGTGPHSVLGLGHDRTDDVRDGESPGRRGPDAGAGAVELDERLVAMEGFVGMAAHQLAEPLVIAESSAILVAEQLGPDLDPALQARLGAIGRAASRARQLMDALLEDARATTNALELHPVDVAEVVEDTLSALAPRIEEQRSVVQVDPLPCVRAERRLLSVVLDNLVANALKHGPREGGVISIGAEPVEGGWRVRVTSGGPPIAAGDVRRILEPFVRLPGERRLSGSGLGLSICVRLIDRLGGSLGVEPGRVEGNTFWFVLPAADPS